ncbi:MAG: DUF3179 domain-containing protein [Planctomycetes bacterium]|nr:DUF3179 domain-containing protein [Planctomycetota bacterium]
MKCQTAVVYERTVDDRTLTLGNLRVLVDRAMAMYDTETGSSWNQATGIAIAGHFTGTQLNAIPAATTSLGAWLSSYPNSGVLAPTAKFTRSQRIRIWDPSEADRMLLLVRAGDAARAYPLTRFPESGLLLDVLGGEPIAILFGRQPKVLAVYSRRVGDDVIELDARPVTEDIELLERGGRRRWSAVSGRSRPLRSARPLRVLSSVPIERIGFEHNFAEVEVYGGPLPPLAERRSGTNATVPSPVMPAAPLDEDEQRGGAPGIPSPSAPPSTPAPPPSGGDATGGCR